MKIFIPDVISQHNYRAIRSSNPAKTSRKKCKYLVNKFTSLLNDNPHLCSAEITYIDWKSDVETSSEYIQQLKDITTLFYNNEHFHKDTVEATSAALQSLWKWKKSVTINVDKEHDQAKLDEAIYEDSSPGIERLSSSDTDYDIMEGVNYMLKEYAFFFSIPQIYDGFDQFVYIYHRPWAILQNLINGVYDKKVRSHMGFVVLE